MGKDLDGRPRAHPRSARWPEDLEMVRRHFQDYRQWLSEHRNPAAPTDPQAESGLALVDGLIAALPGDYGPPRGDILLWYEGDAVVACGALRELEPNLGEIKRVFVRPDFRGREFGAIFVRDLVRRSRELGYERLRVDTLPTMSAAIEFYQEAGFRPIPAYWSHPAPGALFFERRLVE